MKIKIIELLEMINDGKAPQKILYEDEVYEYKEADYQNEDDIELFGTIFSNYNVNYVLNEYVVILETTINTKDMNITSKKIENKYDYQTAQIPPWFRNEELISVINENFEKHTEAIYKLIDYINGDK